LDEDSEEEMLVNRWKRAAKKSKTSKKAKTANKKSVDKSPKSILKKTVKKKEEVREKFDPMTVLCNRTINDKSKLSDLIIHTVAKNQVQCILLPGLNR
jgi:hypothetical protein